MKSIDSLSIEIVLIDGKLTAVCRDLGVTVEGDGLYQLTQRLRDAYRERIFDLRESGSLEVTEFAKALVGPCLRLS